MKFNSESYLSKIKNLLDQCDNLRDLQQLQSQYLGRKSELAANFTALKTLVPAEKVTQALILNKVKMLLIKNFNARRETIIQKVWSNQLKHEQINPHLNPLKINTGARHPLGELARQVKQFFSNLGYNIVSGQELERDVYNFQKLNIPSSHPARANHDSFYINDQVLLRTHCTNVTARMIEKLPPDQKYFGCISVGNVYRRDDDDATHSHQFQQIDGVLIGPDISFRHLKWTLQQFCNIIFGKSMTINFRPNYFPFTEPSVELDVGCPYCNMKGCSICKFNGYIEVLGAGMINPNVFKECGQSSRLQGMAFGIGLERIAMIKYGIDDIRYFYKNDIRFLKQFKDK